MFDVGNSIMCTGMTYALTASCIGYADGRKDKFSMKNIAQKLLHSVPFVVYISMLLLSLAGVHFPKSVYTFTEIVGTGNPFLSMLMIGMMFEIKLDKKAMGYVKELFSVRYAISLLCAAVFLYLAPFKQEINYVIALAFMAPCTIIGEAGSKCTAGQPVQFIDDYYQRRFFYSFFHYNKWLIDVGLNILV